ncbi:putative cytochrome c peroxidase [Magnetofaba australis IT-1]|uniref:Putative cytochrome c peroxidase n=1 Tax=Magnetofaba australis IT-1 TaxID=1434232 RepID=A0A1Y2K8S1_9PROT|nr:putative cytochrome c peroxidase [Magnetofaba australis IT-1]
MSAANVHADDRMADLGRQLFFDVNLSQNRTQACATCHDPNHGFVDGRDNGVEGMASLGDDGKSLGDRNAPTASYAAFVPPFVHNAKGNYVGGLFHDGRAGSLADQAGGPPLNPIEMGLKDKAEAVARIQENPDYVAAFKTLYGADVFSRPERAYAAMSEAIQAYERTAEFAPFDSKYDRYLRGEAQLSEQEELGRTLFFSQQFTNCNLCHQLRTSPMGAQETFSNYEHHNIGVPVNTALRAKNGAQPEHVDRGLLENPAIDDPAQAGKFKTPTLRNIAVTGPYMHNGVFKDLRTVILFYNSYNTKSAKRKINPETGQPFAPPEVAENLSLKELQSGPALDDKRIDALVAFLKTLTDARYVE